MTDDTVLVDLSQFIRAPLHTGIQRVCYEIVSRWPAGCPFRLIRIASDGTADLLPDDALERMKAFFSNSGEARSRERERLTELDTQDASSPLTRDRVLSCRAILAPELFADPARIDFYQGLASQMADRLFFLAYDFVPFVHPELFDNAAILPNMAFIHMLRRMKRLAFISSETRRTFRERLARSDLPDGPVLPLGSDGLGVAEPDFSQACRRFTCLGTLEPRKRHEAILDAFESLWREGSDVRLTFIGMMGWLEDDVQDRVETLAETEARFEWLTGLSDEAVGEILREIRATIYASRIEGFGLPPLESLSLGVPAIVSDCIPSVVDIEPHGQVRLKESSADEIRAAVLRMLDDDFARRKCDEIPNLALPTWDGLSQAVAEWVG